MTKAAGEGPTGPFRVNERVLVPHTDKYYEAKCLKAEKRSDGLWYYYLHYNGWNKKYDEWVEAPGLVKYDPKLTKLDLSKKGRKKKAGNAEEGVAGGEAGEGAAKKRRADDIEVEVVPREDSVEPGAPREVRDKVRVEIPEILLKILQDDQRRVMRDGRLVPLPRRPSVTDVLAQFAEALRSRRPPEAVGDPADEVVTGMRIYFDKALSHLLLYNNEREQCQKALTSMRLPSTVYGAEHLLRLLAKLPELIPTHQLAPEALTNLETRVAEFVTFLKRHHAQFFLAPADYQPAAQALPAAL